MTPDEKQLIDGFIRKYSRDFPNNPSAIYSGVKVQIGKSLFNNSLTELEQNRSRYDVFLKYISEQLGLQ